MKELILLKLIIVKNVVCHFWYFNHGFKFQIFFCNDAMIWRCCVLIWVIMLLKVLIFVAFSMTLANSKQFICLKIVYLMILGIYEIYINIKNWICNFSNSLIESEKLETKKFLIDEKNFKDLVSFFTMLTASW